MVVCHIGGVEFSAYRFTLGLSALYLLITKQFKCYTNRFSKVVFFVLLIWILYGLISLVWTPVLIYGIQELFYLLVGLTSYLVFFSFANAQDKFEYSLEKIWIATFVTIAVFLVLEILTQRHLEGEYLRELNGVGDFHKNNLIPLFTFINQNILGIYFCISIVFAAYFLINNGNKLMNSMIILTSIDFLLLTESRLGVMCIITLVIVSLFLVLFKQVRKRISLSFSWKQALILLLFIGMNIFIIRLEYRFLNPGLDFQSHANEKTGSIHSIIHSKIAERIKNGNRVLVMSNDKIPVEFQNDMVFGIEEHAHLKLLKGDTVNLVLKPLSPNLRREVFMGGNQLLVILLSCLILCLVITYLIIHRFNKQNVLVLFSSAGIFLIAILPIHRFIYPADGYRSSVLTEVDFNAQSIQLKDLQTISVVAVTGNLLKERKEIRTFLYSNNIQQGNDQIVPPERLSSNTIRKNLVLNGFEYLKSSHYMGLGAGGFLASNLKKLNKYPDGGVGGAHNFIIEILSQYGVVIFSLLTSVCVWILWILFQALKGKRWTATHFLVLWLLISLIFMGNANSSFLSLPINWVLIGFVLIFANKSKEMEKPDTHSGQHSN
jgi:hypothetical protein